MGSLGETACPAMTADVLTVLRTVYCTCYRAAFPLQAPETRPERWDPEGLALAVGMI